MKQPLPISNSSYTKTIAQLRSAEVDFIPNSLNQNANSLMVKTEADVATPQHPSILPWATTYVHTILCKSPLPPAPSRANKGKTIFHYHTHSLPAYGSHMSGSFTLASHDTQFSPSHSFPGDWTIPKLSRTPTFRMISWNTNVKSCRTRSGNRFSDFVCSRQNDRREDKWKGLLSCLSFIIITTEVRRQITLCMKKRMVDVAGDRMIKIVLLLA